MQLYLKAHLPCQEVADPLWLIALEQQMNTMGKAVEDVFRERKLSLFGDSFTVRNSIVLVFLHIALD